MTGTRFIRILYLQSTSEIGGSDLTLLRTIEALDRSRFEPFLVLPSDGPLVARFREAGCHVYIEPGMRKLTSRRGFRYLVQYVAGFLPAVYRIVRFIRRENIDLVHTNTIHNWYGFLAARWAHRPHIWHVREIVVQSRLIAWLERALARRFATVVIAMSDAIEEPFRTRRGRAENVRKLYDGIDIDEFHPRVRGDRIRMELGLAKDTPLIGTVCRLDPWKGVDIFLEVASRVQASIPAARFLVCGGAIDGHEGYETRLRQKAGALGNSDSVIFSGWKYRDRDIPEIYAALDVSVQCPINPEPYGLANIEAMATGTPVVAVARGGPVELCENGVTAVLTEPNDIEGMAAAIVSLLQDRERRNRMAAAGRQRAERLFDRGKCIRVLEALYDEAMASSNRTSPRSA